MNVMYYILFVKYFKKDCKYLRVPADICGY